MCLSSSDLTRSDLEFDQKSSSEFRSSLLLFGSPCHLDTSSQIISETIRSSLFQMISISCCKVTS